MTATDATTHVLNLYVRSLHKHSKWIRAQEARPIPGNAVSLESRRMRLDQLRREFEDARDEHVKAVMALGGRS